jgi:flagellar hook-associated protein 3 FlgL
LRVTQNNLYNSSLTQLQSKREKMMNAQQELSTQKRINQPSDDPVGTVNVLSLRTDDANSNQFKENSELAEIFLNYSDTALSQLTEVVNQAKELTISQASVASANPETRTAIAETVKQLYDQTVNIANQKLGDRYIFGGYHTTSSPFNGFGEYLGDKGSIRVEIAEGVFLPINLNGASVFLGEGEENGTDIFITLRDLHTGLMTDDTLQIQGVIDKFDQFHKQLIQDRAKIGSRIESIKASRTGIEQGLIDNSKLKSEIEDADIVRAATEIKKEEDILQSTLSATTKLLQPSLIQFLK